LFAAMSLIGTDDAMVRYVAILSSRRDRDGVAGTLQIGIGTGLIGSAVAAVLLYLFAGPIAEGWLNSPELARALRLMAMMVPVLALSNTLLGIARGFKRMDYAAYSQNGVQSIVRLFLVGLLSIGGWLTLYPGLIAFGLSDVAASVALLILLSREFPLREVTRRGVRRDVRPIFAFALPLWISGLLRQFRNNIQNVLVGSFGTIAGVGVLSVANRVNDVASLGSKSIYIASRPLMAQLHDRKERGALRALYTATTRWTLALNVPLFLVMAFFPDVILQLFGAQFVRGATALALVACAQMISAATGTCQGMLDMTGHTKWKLINTITWTTLLIGGGVLAIPRWGVLGAAASALLAIGTVNVAAVIEVWFLEGVQPYDRSFIKPVVAAVIAAVGAVVLRATVPVEGVIAGLAQAGLIAIGYLVILLILGLEPADRMIVDRVLGKLHLRRPRTIPVEGRP
jgi:O-antigen/teichoic acid export membrane protein